MSNLLTRDEVEKYLKVIDLLPPDHADIPKIHALLKADRTERCKDSFMAFVGEMWPSFISGRHHKIMADAFERVAAGTLKRLIINMPPRHTKSEFASYLFPAWFLGKYPQKKIIQTAHTAELAVGFGRKVRNLVNSADYQAVFPTKLSSDSKAAGRWNTDKGGDYFAIGVGGAVTGKGADVLIIDDPHSEQEAMLGNPEVYDRVYEWYGSGPRQRLQPGGAIVVVMCMTGDTPVLMADGVEKPLRDVRPGDVVATFDNGKLKTAEVLNHQSNGVDSIYQIQTLSGRIIRANERHPFLVMNEGELEWTRLKNLQIGDGLVSLKDAIGRQEQKQSPDFVERAWRRSHTTAKTQTHRAENLAIMESGRENNVSVESQCIARECALSATESNTLLQDKPQSKTELGESNTGTESPLKNTIQWLKSAATSAMCVAKSLLAKTRERIGIASSALTTTMIPERFADFCATTAILRSGMEKRQKYLNELHRTSDFTVDPIVSITYAGEEEVFDVQIDRTENFVANGVVSHNTRWSKRDLTGQILNNAAKRDGDEWEVIEFPALMPSGAPLWPEFWSQKELEAIKAEIPVSKWEAQYQQNPTSEGGAIIKREYWKIWDKEYPPQCEYVIQSWDTAFEKNSRADFSVCTTWGVFYRDSDSGDPVPNIILLDCFKARMEFPELKREAYRLYQEFQPDSLIIEKKAAGAPLIYELRAIGVPLSEYTPNKGSDKIARVNAVSDLFASGYVWCPETRWAEEAMEECASFPNGEHDDIVDSTSQALLRFRQGGFIRMESDEPDEPHIKRRVAYY